MLNGFLKGLNILLFVVAIPLLIAVVTVPPALVCFFMGWSFFVYEHLAGLWILLLGSWFMVYAFFKGWLQ